jgi:hypothetical protein
MQVIKLLSNPFKPPVLSILKFIRPVAGMQARVNKKSASANTNKVHWPETSQPLLKPELSILA